MAGRGSSRPVRVGMLLKEEIAITLSREMKDPTLSAVTVTHVKVSKDLRMARVYYSVLGTEGDRAKAGARLAKAAGFVRSELGKRLRMKRIPELSFQFDDSFEEGMKIDRLLMEIHENE